MNKKDQVVSLIVKLNFLILGLGLVVYFIWHLNNRGLPKGATEAMGLGEPRVEGSRVNVKLCPTRVNRIEFSQEKYIFEEKMQWKSHNGAGAPNTQIDQVGIEKWLSRFCTFPATVSIDPTGVLEPVAMFSYVDGSARLLFYSHQAQIFTLDDLAFKSQELMAGLTELADLAGIEKPVNSTSDVD